MAARSDLMKLPKEDLADGISRLGSRVKRMKDIASKKANDVMGVALAGAGAGAVGYFVGMQKAKDDYDAENGVRLLGVDVDLLAGAGLTLVGLSGMAGKKTSEYMKYMGVGALSYWIGTFAEDKAIQKAQEA